MLTSPSFRDGDGDDMNASLWGELQSFIDLSVIYAKLPLAPFFRLRQVCKEWNRLASDRQFLEANFKPPISSNPYFVVTRRRVGFELLNSEDSSWSRMPLPRSRLAVSGLLFDDSNRKRTRVFDIHTRVFYTLPPLPAVAEEWLLPGVEGEGNHGDPMIGMTVDTTVIPYGFRVILADQVIDSWIYDSTSGAWTLEPSASVCSAPVPITDSCFHCNKPLYMRVLDEIALAFHFHFHDLERDECYCQEPAGVPKVVWECGDIGMWRDRWFVFGVKPGSVLTVWELSAEIEDPWSLFDRMPGDLCEWILRGSLGAQSRFCGEHVLVYNRVGYEERAVLYNLDRQTWDKIELPELPPSP